MIKENFKTLASLIKDRPVVFFDLETTGISVTQDRITQIHMLKISPGTTETTTLSHFVNPQMEVSESAEEKTGLTLKKLINCPVFKDIADEVLEFIEGCDLGGYNIKKFDVPILFEEFMRIGITSFNPFKIKLIDVFVMECTRNKRTLSAIYEKYTNKNLEDAHEASADVNATVEICNKQLELYGDNEPSDLDMIVDAEFNEEYKCVDIVGSILEDRDGNIVFGFGKHKHKPVIEIAETDKSYIDWMLSNDFSYLTKIIIKNSLKSILTAQ